MSNKPSARRIVMSKSVARQWLEKQANPEFRIKVFNPNAKNYPSVLRSFRDGKLKLAGVEPVPDLDGGCPHTNRELLHLQRADQRSVRTSLVVHHRRQPGWDLWSSQHPLTVGGALQHDDPASWGSAR